MPLVFDLFFSVANLSIFPSPKEKITVEMLQGNISTKRGLTYILSYIDEYCNYYFYKYCQVGKTCLFKPFGKFYFTEIIQTLIKWRKYLQRSHFI